MWRKNIRLKHYNYKNNGYYFVTICTTYRKPLLGSGAIYRTSFKKHAEKILLSLTQKIAGVNVDYYKFMLSHLHVIFVLNDSKLFLSEIVRRYKALVTKETKIKPFWEWNYYEHVIRNEKALYAIRKYIEENAEKEKIDLKTIDVA